MQHDLFANPSLRLRPSYPFIAVLQADVVESNSTFVVPLIPASARMPRSRMLPFVEHDGAVFAVAFELLSNVPQRSLRDPVGSIAQYRDDLTRALDWLFFGI